MAPDASETFSLEKIAAALGMAPKDLVTWVDRLPRHRRAESIEAGRLTLHQATAVAAGAWFATRLRHRTAAQEAFSLLVIDPPDTIAFVVVKDGRKPARISTEIVLAAFGHSATRRHVPLVFDAFGFAERLTGGAASPS